MQRMSLQGMASAFQQCESRLHDIVPTAAHLLVLSTGDFLQEVCHALAFWALEAQEVEELHHL